VIVHTTDLFFTTLFSPPCFPHLFSLPPFFHDFFVVFAKVPGVKIMFAHSGGAFPGTVNRVQWGYKCRPDLVAVDSKRSPRELLGGIYVDSICHDPEMMVGAIYYRR
jgi:hypothetical protein